MTRLTLTEAHELAAAILRHPFQQAMRKVNPPLLHDTEKCAVPADGYQQASRPLPIGEGGDKPCIST